MRGPLLAALHAEITVQHAKWLTDPKLAKHLTLTLDGWSNARMESIYSFNIIFPDRRVILVKSEDLSLATHSGQGMQRNPGYPSIEGELEKAICKAGGISEANAESFTKVHHHHSC